MARKPTRGDGSLSRVLSTGGGRWGRARTCHRMSCQDHTGAVQVADPRWAVAPRQAATSPGLAGDVPASRGIPEDHHGSVREGPTDGLP